MPVMLIGIIIFISIVIRDMVKKRRFVKRLLYYCFILYVSVVAQLTLGAILFPPAEDPFIQVQLEPFYFVKEWSTYTNYESWSFYNNARLTFYNFLLLMPGGFFLAFLFKVKRWKGAFLLFGASLTIETLQLILSYSGLIRTRGFNTDDLIMNTAGGLIVFLIFKAIRGRKIKKTIKTEHRIN